MKLSKAYNCVNHNLIIAKLAAFETGESKLRLTQNHPSEKQQRVKVDSSFSE